MKLRFLLAFVATSLGLIFLMTPQRTESSTCPGPNPYSYTYALIEAHRLVPQSTTVDGQESTTPLHELSLTTVGAGGLKLIIRDGDGNLLAIAREKE